MQHLMVLPMAELRLMSTSLSLQVGSRDDMVENICNVLLRSFDDEVSELLSVENDENVMDF